MKTGGETEVLKNVGAKLNRGLRALKIRGYMLFMLHVSAAFKGGDIQNFWEGGRTLYGGTQHFMGGLDNSLETITSH